MSLQPTNQSLDELAKGLATGTVSRGKAIRWMGGALLGAALASLPGVAWADGCRGLGRACRRDSQCCSSNCIGRGDDKVCGCRAGQTLCKKPRGEGRCVNLKTNERHCGAECGSSPPACPPEQDNCCTCIYRNPTTSARVSTCSAPFPGDVAACVALCNASVPPPGTELFIIQHDGGSEGVVPVCRPATEGTTGTECVFTPCTPPPPPP
jgi:hypothetical protein